MILNAKNNNFRVELASNFFNDDIIKKYEFVLKRLPSPWKSIRNYINAGIQEFSLPSISLPVAEQYNLHNPTTPWKGKGNMEFNIDKEFSITFKLYEGFINYWILLEHLEWFYQYTTRAQVFPNTYLSFLDNLGYELICYKFGRVLFTGISELNLSFSSNIPEFKTFTCDFRYTNMDVLRRLQ